MAKLSSSQFTSLGSQLGLVSPMQATSYIGDHILLNYPIIPRRSQINPIVTYHSHVLLVFFTCDATVTTIEPVHNDITTSCVGTSKYPRGRSLQQSQPELNSKCSRCQYGSPKSGRQFKTHSGWSAASCQKRTTCNVTMHSWENVLTEQTIVSYPGLLTQHLLLAVLSTLPRQYCKQQMLGQKACYATGSCRYNIASFRSYATQDGHSHPEMMSSPNGVSGWVEVNTSTDLKGPFGIHLVPTEGA